MAYKINLFPILLNLNPKFIRASLSDIRTSFSLHDK